MDPLVFMRALYCVDGDYRPLRGASRQRAVGCPTTGGRAAPSSAAHPGLFRRSGWAHHPYDFTHAPSYRRPDRNAATLSGISHLETALEPGLPGLRQAGPSCPIYITEWGVQSRGRAPMSIFSQAQQAEYINEGEYMAWRDPRIRSFAQFLLTDAAPNTAVPEGLQGILGDVPERSAVLPVRRPSRPTTRSSSRSGCRNPTHGPRVPIWAQIRPSPRIGDDPVPAPRLALVDQCCARRSRRSPEGS